MRELMAVLWAIVAFCALIPSVSGDQIQDVIGQARREYYSLANRGVKCFRATIEPNWEVTLGTTATRENLKVFRALSFSMTFDAGGVVTVSHKVVKTPTP